MKTIQRAEHGQTMINGLRGGWGLFIELVAHIMEQSRFLHLQQSVGGMLLAPTCEVQEIISKDAQGTERELANTLRIQELIGPGDFLSPVVDQAVEGGAGRNIPSME